MPLTSETGSLAICFDCSVAAELLFLLEGTALPPELAERARSFWGDSVAYWELLVIADEAGALVGPVEAASIAGWTKALDTVPTKPALRSEPEHDRSVITDRLRRLSREKTLRKRYLALISEVWAAFEAEWRDSWLPVIERSIEECRAREQKGASWQSVLKGAETSSEILDAGWARAREAGAATVGICAYGGSLVIDLPGAQFFARSVKDQTRPDRERAAGLAHKLRAVADPTRLSLLVLLAERPRSIGELADALGVSQPTVSNHVKVLREAGVVGASSAGKDRRILQVDEDALAQLFREVSELVSAD